jgi:hypothetical protein
MSVPEGLSPLAEPLAAVQRLLTRFQEKGVIIGGVAVSLLGKPRLTADVDAVMLVSVEDVPYLLEVAKQEGLLPRFSDVVDFARRHRVVLLRHQASGINVDVSLGILPFEEETVERSMVQRVGTLDVRLPTVEDLIILKAVAHRPKDLLDIQGLIEGHQDLDRRRIRRWVSEFAEALDMPEIWNDIAPWLK